jgi:hypothetical protein
MSNFYDICPNSGILAISDLGHIPHLGYNCYTRFGTPSQLFIIILLILLPRDYCPVQPRPGSETKRWRPEIYVGKTGHYYPYVLHIL